MKNISRRKELLYKERLLDTALEYTRETFVPYATDENINLICKHVTDYHNGFRFDDIEFAIVHDLSTYDLLWLEHLESFQTNTEK